MTDQLQRAAGHTPGPWFVRTLENFGWNIVHYIGGDKFDIARIAKVSSEGDARLISAAPELLEALEAFNITEKNILGGTADNLTIRVPIGVLQKAAAAIAKAKGQP